MKLKYFYLAGYIDGDGCFFLQKIKHPLKYRAKLIVSSTNKVILLFFQENFKGFIQKQKVYKANFKPQFHWYINGINALELLNNFKYYLIERDWEAFLFTRFIQTRNKQYKEQIRNFMTDHRNFNKHITREIFEDIKSTEFKNNFTEDDAAYLAGFIDAECCLGISKYKKPKSTNFIYKIILSCNNTSPNIFYWFMEKIGGSVCFIPRNEKNPKHKNQINWNISGNKLYEILLKVHPFIRSKKDVCEKLMEFYQLTLDNGGDRQSEEFKSSYSKIISQKEKIVDIVHFLNSKGQ